MNDIDRKKVIDYVLDRMSPEESRAFERRVREDSELAQAVASLSEELVNVSSFDDKNSFLRRFFGRLSRSKSTSSDVPASPETAGRSSGSSKANESSDNVKSPASSETKRNKKRFRFIPKRVVVPQREQSSLVVKRAAVLSDEELQDIRARLSPLAKAELRSFFGFHGSSFRLVDTIVNSPVNVASFAKPFDFSDSLTSSTEFDEFVELYAAVPTEFDARALLVEPVPSVFDYATTRDVSTPFENADIAPGLIAALSSAVSVSSETPASTRYFRESVDDRIPAMYAISPLEYTSGFPVPVIPEPAEIPGVRSYPFSDLGADRERTLPIASALEDAGPQSREEVLEEIAAIFGQNDRILQQTPSVYFAVAGDSDDEENGPSLTEEDRFLAELLGHDPDAFERSEYYWDDEVSVEKAATRREPGLLAKAIHVATAPPVAVGRAAIGVFHLLVAEDFERKEARGQTRRRDTKRGPTRFSDFAIPLIAGVALAVGVIFPALKYVATEIYATVAESRVRKISGNFTVYPGDMQVDVIPFISEQILFPRYEAVEFSSDGLADGMESDGYPVITIEK
ncbi:MAG: hypothetical protein ACOX0A_05200 [Thermoguttaceae bacterium]